ncbi:hypothetical protein CDIK_2212 [Cucumispora dikerogammari]|nr:hypothetical protein CDIK_2212 [Cucumispora dikerogammari]
MNLNTHLNEFIVYPNVEMIIVLLNRDFFYAEQFIELQSRFSESEIIFVDETGFNVSMRLSRDRALIGKQSVSIVPFIRGRNISVCPAKNIQGILHYETKQFAYNLLLFKQFLINLFEILSSQNKTNAIFIMDNVRFHKSNEIKEIFVNSGYECFYLPPYFLFLNSIKNMFSK